jgi:hypothetical protein
MGIVNVHKYADTIKNWSVYIGLNRILIHLIRVHLSSVWGQLKPHLRGIVRGIEPLRMTGSHVSHVSYPEVCHAHAQPEVAQYPP